MGLRAELAALPCLRESVRVACAELGLSITSGDAAKVNAPPRPEHSRGTCWGVMELGLRNAGAWLLLLQGAAA